MPSRNYYVDISNGHRVLINVCEGEVSITLTKPMSQRIVLSNAQARDLALKILEGVDSETNEIIKSS